jgi:hypothetical protein
LERCFVIIELRLSGERVTGIEPAFSAWEADVLPLNYTREGGTEVSVGT